MKCCGPAFSPASRRCSWAASFPLLLASSVAMAVLESFFRHLVTMSQCFQMFPSLMVSWRWAPMWESFVLCFPLPGEMFPPTNFYLGIYVLVVCPCPSASPLCQWHDAPCLFPIVYWMGGGVVSLLSGPCWVLISWYRARGLSSLSPHPYPPFFGQYRTWWSRERQWPHWLGRPLYSRSYSIVPSPSNRGTTTICGRSFKSLTSNHIRGPKSLALYASKLSIHITCPICSPMFCKNGSSLKTWHKSTTWTQTRWSSLSSTWGFLASKCGLQLEKKMAADSHTKSSKSDQEVGLCNWRLEGHDAS